MLFAVDIGNTNIVFGCFKSDKLLFELRVKTELDRTVDEYAAIVETLLRRKLGAIDSFSAAVISSVVPPITGDIQRMVGEVVGCETLVVGPGVKTGIALKVHEPQSVGSDRVVNALAAREIFGPPAIVIDFGTATSFDVVNLKGEYEGGVIAPGAAVALDSLVRRTAKLPRIELVWPPNVVGKNTVAAMQSGIVIGYVALVEGLIARIQAEIKENAKVVATGGLGSLFCEHCPSIMSYDPHLTLKGLNIIAKLNQLV